MPTKETEKTYTVVNHRFDNSLLKAVERDRKRRSEAAGAKVSRAATINALIKERLSDLENSAA